MRHTKKFGIELTDKEKKKLLMDAKKLGISCSKLIRFFITHPDLLSLYRREKRELREYFIKNKVKGE